ncbi:RNA polymerase Rpc34 subunit-domain-containing protein [Phanerochaete sordida]|uniref:RNA polymerase Rpc34 subunit-domain-containing protein n=1 Tax=Phanerochaete sordida TaxID=48140 RepID=A0A9P3GST9_9APHY|nr:RNA polymerase Rpc34 subunit-domain-containing protein [Phanerochaete sordida]
MSRKLNSLEQKIHQAALAADERTITNKELEALAPDQAARTGAINFLLSAGLLKVLKDSGGRLQFRAVVKKELDAKKDLSGEESLVLGHIQAAGNEGIWTKHIKVKTELHQTVIDRCLKSLTQKKLVKCISGSVQHPTRKIYMLFHLEPSTEMTGGPWYTDKELDTEFIKLLTAACLKFIRDRSFPRSKSGESSQRLLYPISAAPSYPTAAQVQVFLNKSRITETQLTVEHVETLLNVLVLDGDVEKVPALGATLWESALDENDQGSSSEEEKPKSKKRKREAESSKRKKKRRKTHSSDESDLDSDDGSRRSKSKSKSESKSKSKRRKKHDTDSESDSGSESDSRQKKKKSKKRRSRDSSDESDSGTETESEDDRRGKKRSKSRSKSKSKKHASDSESDSESDAPKSRSRSRSKSKTKRETSPEDYAFDDDALGGAHVYRAVHPERMAHFGVAQAPCGRCPVFDFCTAGGPVNPQECVYYADWLPAAEVKLE